MLVAPISAQITPEALVQSLSEARAEVAVAELKSAQIKAKIEEAESLIKSDITNLSAPIEVKKEEVHRSTIEAKELEKKIDEIAVKVDMILAEVKSAKTRDRHQKSHAIISSANRKANAEKGEEFEEAVINANAETGATTIRKRKRPIITKRVPQKFEVDRNANTANAEDEVRNGVAPSENEVVDETVAGEEIAPSRMVIESDGAQGVSAGGEVIQE
jgi:hypothetical protein